MMRINQQFPLLSTVIAVICAAVGTASYGRAQDEFAPLFPFVISHEAPDNVTNMSHLLDAPAGKHGFVRVENGNFVTAAGPIKFNAVNLTGAANFPTHEQADALAARLARFGINCVRLHYFDAPYGNFRNETQPSIFGGKASDPSVTVPFDDNEVDRFDYLIAALKKRGIYVNMNLHVGRFPKGISFFASKVIASEKDYAQKLLTHVNPYTGLAYTDEPSVAMIEINNENSLFNRDWSDGNRSKEPYVSEFQQQWNAWLKNKYSTTEAMYNAWGPKGAQGNSDKDVMANVQTWTLNPGSAEAVIAEENGVMKITVEKEGDNLFPKLLRNGIKMKKGESYNISFKVRRVDGAGKVKLGTAIANTTKGSRLIGFHRIIEVDEQWSMVKANFVSSANTDNAQFQLTRFKKGVYEVDNLTIQIDASAESQSLEKGTVLALDSKTDASFEAKSDFYRFMEDTEKSYWTGMANYVRDELKAKAPICGTQLGYGLPFIQAALDYVDIHSYWCHPSPVNKNWRVENKSMVNSMERIQSMASQRVLGKPYTVSEYNHPFPNQYGAEGQPMLHAYGAMQGWDGLFAYTWHHRRDPEPGLNSYFFSIAERTDVLAHMQACAAIFLRGDVHQAKQTVAAAIDYDSYFKKLVAAPKEVKAGITTAGFPRDLTMVHQTGVDLSGKEGTDPASVTDKVADAKVLFSDTEELCWNREKSNAGYFTVNTAGTKLFSGFPDGRTITMGDVTLKVGKTRLNWATVSLVSRFAEGSFGENSKAANILLAATGQASNKGMQLNDGGKSSFAGSEWGEAPMMAEGIPAVIGLPSEASRTRCYALDSNGGRVKEVPVEKSANGCQIAIGPKYKTVWYEIEVK